VITNWRHCRGEETEAQLPWETTRSNFDDRQSLDTFLGCNHLSGDSIGTKWLREELTPGKTKKDHWQHQFQILRRSSEGEKSLQRQTSGSARASNPGISTNTSSFISKEPLVESPSAETSSSQKIEIVSESLKGEEPSISSDVIDSISEHVITSNLREEVVGSPQQKDSSSSLNSSPTKPIEGVFHTHTSLPVLEDILQDLSSKGEENLALLLGQFYRASYFPPYSGNFSQGSHPTSVSPSFLSEVRQPLFIGSPIPSQPSSSEDSSSASTPKISMAVPLTKMEQILANRYAPLVLPNPLSAMPTGDYQKYMPKFTGSGDYTAEEHIEAFYAYAENINISEEDVWTRIFVQSLDGQARKWFKELPTNSVAGIEQLDEVFLKHWGERRDLLYYISEFGNLRRENGESVSDFTKRFNKMFGKIPAEIKPTDASTKITYSSSFDPEFCLILRERRSTTLALMQDVSLEVESNIMASQKLKGKFERKKSSADPPSSSNTKMEKMAKMLDNLTSEMSKLKIQSQQPARIKEPNAYAPRNPNAFPYRRNNQQVQILQRDKNAADDQRIRAPFQNAMLEEEHELPHDEVEEEDDINCFGDENDSSFLTQVDYEEAQMDEEIHEASIEEYFYQTDDQPGYNLRSKTAAPKPLLAAPGKKKEVVAKQPAAPVKQTSTPAKQQQKQLQPQAKEQVILRAPPNEVKTSDRLSYSFNFESEIQKVKIPMPLTELMKNDIFKSAILKSLEPKTPPAADYVNLQDDKPTVTIGPMVEDRDDSCPPFYISLNIHDKILHNCLLDSGASHNLMPKAVMDELGLDVTKPYHDLFSFDSRKVRCLGLIKYLVINLAQLPMRNMVMDVVVADIPPKFGLLLSRSWRKRLGGTLQMDLSYATVPVFGGELKRLYRENQLAYIISDGKNSVNHPIYALDTDFGSCILQIDDSQPAPLQLTKPTYQQTDEESIPMWTMFFDGASTKDSAGAGVVLISPSKEAMHLSFKLDFKTTNNIAEYEAFLLGLNSAKEMGIKGLKVFGDADLIIQQVNSTFQAKHVRLKAYRDEVWKIRDSFSIFDISYVPRAMNHLVDSLAVSASMFIPPMPPRLNYEIQVKYRPSLPDNIKYWKVFEDDDELSRFLQVVDEFSDMHIDQKNQNVEESKKPKLKRKMGQHDIVQLPNNYIPRGLVPLEKLFDHNDVPYKPDKKEKDPTVHEHNIGSQNHPKFINLSIELTVDQRSEYCSIMKEFADVFAWKYSDLKTYDPEVIQHKIPLEKDTIPFKQKLRPISPLLLPVIEREIKKLLDAKIIIPLRYSKWIANLVIVRKKNGEIRLCVDFRNLNKCSKKDNYPLPKMEHLLQRISGATVMSFLDGFSGYNQISVHPDDQEKTAFTTPWGTFMYAKMPFGLMNVRATFQRAMDIAFVGEKDKFVLIYLDDITVYSSSHEEHLKHLKRVFLKCRQFGFH
jgi:ribonuclease HI